MTNLHGLVRMTEGATDVPGVIWQATFASRVCYAARRLLLGLPPRSPTLAGALNVEVERRSQRSTASTWPTTFHRVRFAPPCSGSSAAYGPPHPFPRPIPRWR